MKVITDYNPLLVNTGGSGADHPKIYIDFNRCNGCGLCEEVCPFGLPKRDFTGKYDIRDVKMCTECSACQRNCPTKAIVLKEQKGCGCLWDTIQRNKNGKDNKDNKENDDGGSCCSSDSSSSCC